jgi:hypothetical protein
MGSTRTARLSIVMTGLLGIGAASCIVPCNEIACDGGFEWTATPADGSTIVPGQYRIELVIEGTTHVVECAIAAGLRDSECGEAVVTDGEELFVWAHLDSRQSSETWDPEAPIEALRVSIADHGDWEDDDRSQSVRGPEEIAITLSLGDRVLLEDEFAPQYERDEDFWGDKRCGYCDEREDGSSQWAP